MTHLENVPRCWDNFDRPIRCTRCATQIYSVDFAYDTHAAWRWYNDPIPARTPAKLGTKIERMKSVNIGDIF